MEERSEWKPQGKTKRKDDEGVGKGIFRENDR